MSIEGLEVCATSIRGPDAITPGAEKLVEHIIFVGGDDQLPDRQPHHACHVTGAGIAEVARRHREGDRLAVARGHREIRLEVVDHLRDESRPVDRVDHADPEASLEIGVGGDALHEVLAVIEDAPHREIEDVGVVERIHLRGLEPAHLAERREHEHANAPFPAHRVLRGRSGIARGRAEYVERFAAAAERVLEEIAEQLHRDILEREGRAVRQPEKVDARLERLDRRDFVAAEGSGGVGALDEGTQIDRRNVIDEAPEDLACEVAITERPPSRERRALDARIRFGDRQPAVGREPFQQDVSEPGRRHAAAGGDVLHS